MCVCVFNRARSYAQDGGEGEESCGVRKQAQRRKIGESNDVLDDVFGHLANSLRLLLGSVDKALVDVNVVLARVSGMVHEDKAVGHGEKRQPANTAPCHPRSPLLWGLQKVCM